VACPSIGQCTAVDSSGREVTFDPTGPGTPTPAVIDPAGGDLPGSASVAAIACPATAERVTVDSAGAEVTFDPGAPHAAVSTEVNGGLGLAGVACPSVHRCAGVGASGSEVSFDPAAPGTPPVRSRHLPRRRPMRRGRGNERAVV
jgi:hypothetical protein